MSPGALLFGGVTRVFLGEAPRAAVEAEASGGGKANR